MTTVAPNLGVGAEVVNADEDEHASKELLWAYAQQLSATLNPWSAELLAHRYNNAEVGVAIDQPRFVEVLLEAVAQFP